MSITTLHAPNAVVDAQKRNAAGIFGSNGHAQSHFVPHFGRHGVDSDLPEQRGGGKGIGRIERRLTIDLSQPCMHTRLRRGGVFGHRLNAREQIKRAASMILGQARLDLLIFGKHGHVRRRGTGDIPDAVFGRDDARGILQNAVNSGVPAHLPPFPARHGINDVLGQFKWTHLV